MVVSINDRAQAFGFFVGYCIATKTIAQRIGGRWRGAARAMTFDIDFRIRTLSAKTC